MVYVCLFLYSIIGLCKGAFLPGTQSRKLKFTFRENKLVTDAQVKHNISRWPVVIDGEVDEKVCGRVRDNTIVLDSRGGLVFTIR